MFLASRCVVEYSVCDNAVLHLLGFMCRRCVGVLSMSPVFQYCDTGKDK